MVANGTREGDGKRARGRALKGTNEGFAGGQWLRLHLPMQGAPVQPLGRELRFHMPLSQNTKTESTGTILTVLIKALQKMVHIKKSFKKYRLIQTK